jgi:alpha-glucosidase
VLIAFKITHRLTRILPIPLTDPTGIGADKSEPPNDWTSEFGGSIWEPTGQEDGQFYMHIFAREQPDLNWYNPDVRADFLKTLRFWGDRGVAGFRVDVAGMLCKDIAQSPPYKSAAELREISERITKGTAGENEHPYRDRLDTFDVYREWRRVFEEYTPALTWVYSGVI